MFVQQVHQTLPHDSRGAKHARAPLFVNALCRNVVLWTRLHIRPLHIQQF
jgi:hypothetical protein